MHAAIAEATGLRYDAIHKAFSGQARPKRVRVEVKDCLEKWLRQTGENGQPDIDVGYRAVPVSQTHALLPKLRERFGTRERVYRRISQRTGIRLDAVRRYFRPNGQVKLAPYAVYQWAKELAEGNGDSYLADERTRRLAQELANEVNAVLRLWQGAGTHAELELRYKELRRALIVTIKEQRTEGTELMPQMSPSLAWEP
jgi:hypothetical protein